VADVKRQVALNPVAEAANVGLAWLGAHAGARIFSRPLYVNIYLNRRCNSRCVSCDAWKCPDPPSLDRALVARIVRGMLDLGVRYAQLSGGEPLLHPELMEIVGDLVRAGIFVQLSTNGLLLDERRARALIDAGITRITVSLDSLDPETYRRFRGVDALSVVRKNLERLVKLSRDAALVETNSLLGEHNLEEVPRLVEQLLDSGVDYASVSSIEYMSRIIHEQDKLHLFPRDLGRLDEVVDQVVEIKHRTGRVNNSVPFLLGLKRYYRAPRTLVYPCYAAWLRMEILPDGGMGLCGPMGTLATLRDQDLRAFWYGPQVAAERRRIARGQCPVCYGPCYTEPSLLANPRHTVGVGLDRVRRLVLPRRSR